MNKTNTAESTLNIIRSKNVERDRKERARLDANRLERTRRDEAEMERLQHTSSILNSYIERAQEREGQQAQEHEKMWQNIHENGERRRAEDAYRSQEFIAAMNRGIQNAQEEEGRRTADTFIDRNKRLLDKGIDAVKRQYLF